MARPEPTPRAGSFSARWPPYTLGRRIATIAVSYALAYLCLFAPGNKHFLFVFCAALIYMVQQELYDILEIKGARVWRVCGISASLLLALGGYLNLLESRESQLLAIPILALFFSTFILQMRRRTDGAIMNLTATHFGFLYVGVPISCAFWIRGLEHGDALILMLLIATGFNDIGGFVVGKAIGRHRLAPSISPLKTWEGAVGGCVFSVAAVLAGGFLFRPLFKEGVFYFAPDPGGEWHAITLTILISVVGVWGDLAESLLKRDAGKKDSGSSLTGHGGYLDLVDSLLFTTPLVLVYGTVALS
jgi:phosphatidate cytidylyltransferase